MSQRFDLADLPFLYSLAVVPVNAGVKHTWTNRDVGASNMPRYHRNAKFVLLTAN